MSMEIRSLGSYPYSAIIHLRVTFPDGSMAQGTGAMVGRNDILTATHVIYDPDRGGWASNLDITVGVDYNSNRASYESQSLVNLDSFSWVANAWPQQVFAYGDNDTMNWNESQYDVALIGLSKAIGEQVGWFGLASGYNQPQWAYQIGYPSGSTGMMSGEAWIEPGDYQFVYNAYASNGSDMMGPGSSGGPLYVYQNESPHIIGVKSASDASISTWADIGLLYERLIELKSENDYLLADLAQPTPPTRILGTQAADICHATPSSELVDGLEGLDVLVYDHSINLYQVQSTAEGVQVVSRLDSQDVDQLFNIERLQFSDGVLAMDVDAGETAGSVYRLYQAAFDRTPDSEGLAFWISAMDQGISLRDVAANVTKSPEFAALYGLAPSTETLLTGYYTNVHDRVPDSQGLSYWQAQMNAGMSKGDVLAYFSESPENLVRVQGAIENGIWLG